MKTIGTKVLVAAFSLVAAFCLLTALPLIVTNKPFLVPFTIPVTLFAAYRLFIIIDRRLSA